VGDRYLPPGLKSSSQAYEALIDHAMHELKGAAWKALMYLARRTVGFGKASDTVSLGQLCHGIRRSDGSRLDWGTGLSKRAAIRGIAELEAARLVHRTLGHGLGNHYAINWPAVQSSEDGTGAEKAPEQVPKRHRQQAVQPTIAQPAAASGDGRRNPDAHNYPPGALDWLRETLLDYPNAPPGEPDETICRKILTAANGASLEAIGREIRSLHVTGERPRQWGFFPFMIAKKFSGVRPADHVEGVGA
jgi:hypothetical protein